MFEKFIREIKQLEMNRPGGVAVSIDMPIDEKGYFDRTCPRDNCGCSFKVIFVDWRDKVCEEAAYCPKCGGESDPTDYNTSWQSDYIAETARAYAADQINLALGRAARQTRPKTISSGLFGITMSVEHRPSPQKIVLPPAANEILRQDFQCSQCQCRYSTIGNGYFCPACGHNSVIQDFDQTLTTTRKCVESLDVIASALGAKHDVDVAANVVDQILEDQVENLVTAMQRVTEAMFGELPTASTFKVDTNLFQRVDDASNKWRDATKSGYDDILASGQLNFLKIMVQRRHKIGHRQGIVDQKYVEKSGDRTLVPGQRLVVRPEEVVRLADILEQLVQGLRKIPISNGGPTDR
ncbi:hypothetical protein [Gimesia maris]|uniref:hypothetical protein n=1 Tax=Gimesia maris TaxID=122 RepID=UPI003A8E2976